MTQAEEIKKYVADKAEKSIKLAKDIWNYAEISFTEFKSCAATIEALRSEGFEIEEGIAGIPTAFKATFAYGTGKPVMGFLAEYDALDGLSQKAGCYYYDPVVPGGNGHGCGHNLLGAGSFSAAVAVKDYLVANQKDGAVMFFGCPAEEGAGSKQFIARAGYFNDVDYVYTWHPGNINQVQATGSVAIMGGSFTFRGISTNPGITPHLGRSALDACELMNVGCNYLREHMIDMARIHYAYSDAGGTAPNVIPNRATIKYEVRAPKVAQTKELFERVTDCAKGAALMTGTTMESKITMAFSDWVPNTVLSEVMDESFAELGAPEWTDEECETAAKYMNTYNEETMQNIREEMLEYFGTRAAVEEALKQPLHDGIIPYDSRRFRYRPGSTDVGDVAYAVPTAQATVTTECMGCVSHSWQRTAFSGSDIGMKGMLKAGEVMALAAIKTMDRPDVIAAAKAELLELNGGQYECPLPDYVQPCIEGY